MAQEGRLAAGKQCGLFDRQWREDAAAVGVDAAKQNVQAARPAAARDRVPSETTGQQLLMRHNRPPRGRKRTDLATRSSAASVTTAHSFRAPR